uniref:Uncharacterized protein n=1 Tax=viral metagenome TaxID=1070528 RepID=A0A6C0BS15_9ZZZZ
MFYNGDVIYIKKYIGDLLVTDTTNKYKIVHIYPKMTLYKGTIFHKIALLDNGIQIPMYTYNIISKERVFFIEHIPFFQRVASCCNNLF